jgi:hypothetical protein
MVSNRPRVTIVNSLADAGFAGLVDRVTRFYESNPWAILYPHDLQYMLGDDAGNISAACEYLANTGFLAIAETATHRAYRRQQ